MASSTAVRPPLALLVAAFTGIARRRLRRSFRAVRVVGGEHLAGQMDGPLIVSVNHASWWDPLVCLAVARAVLPGRTQYAPISAAALKQYALFGWLGMFPVEQSSTRGAAQFLRGAEAVLARGGVLWMTAQGAFTDARVRPAVLKPGLGALVHRLPRVTVVSVAVEYTFWNQRLPEVLVAIGAPVVIEDSAARSSAAWSAVFAGQLESLQDELAALAMLRDPTAFTSLLEGERGTAGFYGAWQRLRARLRGEAATADHVADADGR